MLGYDVESSGLYFPSGMPSRGWRNLCVSYLAAKRITQSLLHSARGARWLWRACVRAWSRDPDTVFLSSPGAVH